MIDHVSIQVRDITVSKTFYKKVLAPLGLKEFVTRPSAVGFGKRYPEFWINLRPFSSQQEPGSGNHICLRAQSESAVAEFHAAALNNGGICDGPPGVRKAELTPYFAAFIIDPDGHRIEAATFPKIRVS
ncbi:MAG: VOC family protein [Alphaproteobacteria bacterium]|jgi:catechol 2,3-dioxygenase-like lactoylglutathione lyase family enzyme